MLGTKIKREFRDYLTSLHLAIYHDSFCFNLGKIIYNGKLDLLNLLIYLIFNFKKIN